MKKGSKQPVLLGVAVMLCSVVTLYGCKDFLTNAALPQGTLDQTTLANKAGVEGSLIAAYRQLDHSDGVGGGWGSAASNWIWASVASDDAYKGSTASDQPGITNVESYSWSAPDAQGDLNDKWRASYEGISRSNATIALLKSIVATKPGELTGAEQKGIEGEATFLRAHYHFEAWKMWGNIPYYRESDTDFRKANLTQAQAIDEILKDLDAAIPLLPATPRNGNVGLGRFDGFGQRRGGGRDHGRDGGRWRWLYRRCWRRQRFSSWRSGLRHAGPQLGTHEFGGLAAPVDRQRQRHCQRGMHHQGQRRARCVAAGGLRQQGVVRKRGLRHAA